ncbi:hypothetical protein ACJJIG_04290 [Microbulbifer sp. SSSA007]|uniref:hypothetical protein n=1 Tax=Microbulbifer sp. SSSA007 TaxID=3243379 RepID=UPI00403A1567
MFYIFGTHKFRKRKNAIKKSYCKSCKSEEIKVEWKWFSWFHMFFIPLIPLGNNSVWVCNKCGRDKQANRETSISVKVLIILFLSLVFFLFFTNGTEKIEILTLWSIRAAVALAVAYFVFTIIKHKERNLGKIFKDVLPLEENRQCLNCGGNLTGNRVLSCDGCSVETYDNV